MGKRGRWAGLALILGLAIALRVGLWAWGAASNVVPPGDAEEYYRAALHMLNGGYHDTGKWLRPPAYPALLALLLPLAGMDAGRAMLFQAVLMGLACLAFYAYGCQIFQRRAVGLLSALIAALFVPFAAFASAMYAEALFVVLIVLGLAILDRALDARLPRFAFAAGLVLAVATLSRAVSLFFLPIAALLLLVLPNLPPATRNWRNGLALAASFTLGAALLIGPWIVRNALVHERLIVIDTNGAISVWFGQVRDPAEKAARDAELFAIPNLADRQSQAVAWTIERVREDPADFLTSMRFKLASLMLLQTRSYAVGDLISIGSDGRPVVQNAGELSFPLTLLADGQYILVMLFGIVGIAAAQQPRRLLASGLWVVVAAGLVAISIGHPRLRWPLVAVFVPAAAYGMLFIRQHWRSWRSAFGNWRSYAALSAMLVFILLIFSTRYITFVRAEWHAFQAKQALASGALEQAQRGFEQAQALDPNNALRTLALADLAWQRGDRQAADAAYAAALALEGRNQYAHAMRAHLARLSGDTATATNELAAIEAFWRVGDDVARWAWRNLPATPPTTLAPDDPFALGHMRGFAPASPTFGPGRWTLGHGEVRLAPTCGPIDVVLAAPAAREVVVAIDGGASLAHQASGAAETVRLSAERPSCASQALVIQISSPTSLLDLEQAPWFVGVRVEAVRHGE